MFTYIWDRLTILAIVFPNSSRMAGPWLSKHRTVSIPSNMSLPGDRLVGQVVKTFASRAPWGFIFPGRVIPVTSKLAFKWLPFQEPGVIGYGTGLPGVDIL